ncbi:MAG: argininosuccinate synthase [Solirubrobacteraceae bacterium]|nr:argininosuccinate synthase [Solirubrobacteraceae bacterium]MEA2137012.1 argininosuccinate synthase [Solirubrobacteraceae bacterium]
MDASSPSERRVLSMNSIRHQSRAGGRANPFRVSHHATAPPGIRSFNQLKTLERDRPVVTLFSGGLDSTYLLLRLRELGFSSVHAMSVDLGDCESSDHKRALARALGVELHIFDRRAIFARDYVLPAIAAQAVYLGVHPISSSLSRPLIASAAIELADALAADTIIHTANRSQNTLRRLNGALGQLGFSGSYGSPYDLEPVDRARKIALLSDAGVNCLSDRSVSGDSNLWCREFESGLLDDPESHASPEAMYAWSATVPADDCVDIEVGFERGIPVCVDGMRMAPVELIATLNYEVGRHGLGRYTGLEHLEGGQKVLEVREMPAAWLLLGSFRHLESACVDAETIREKLHIEQLWVREAIEGRWFGGLRRALQCFVDSCAARVSGSVTWRLANGRATTRSIVAAHPLYVTNRESWEADSIAAESGAFRSPSVTNHHGTIHALH